MRNLFILVVALIISSGVVSSVQAKTDSVLPANFDIPAMFSRDVAQLYTRSPTFRAQCDRLAQAQHLHVSMTLDMSIPRACRAFTVITRRRGSLCADVHLPVSAQFAELIAHEFEHIIEQLEHVNLRKLAAVRGSGVSEVGFDVFETERAQAAGRIVAVEAREFRTASR